MDDAPPRRRWFTYSLRTLFVVVTVLCLWLGWQANIIRERAAVLREIRARGGRVFRWDEDPGSISGPLTIGIGHEPLGAALRRLAGDEDIRAIEVPADFEFIERARARRAFPDVLMWQHP